MPKMNGRETFAAIQKIKSDIKVIFMSGYTSDIIAGKGVFYGRVGPEDAAADHPHQGGPGPGPDGGFLQAQAVQHDELRRVQRDADCQPLPDWAEQMLAPFGDQSIAGVKGITR